MPAPPHIGRALPFLVLVALFIAGGTVLALLRPPPASPVAPDPAGGAGRAIPPETPGDPEFEALVLRVVESLGEDVEAVRALREYLLLAPDRLAARASGRLRTALDLAVRATTEGPGTEAVRILAAAIEHGAAAAARDGALAPVLAAALSSPRPETRAAAVGLLVATGDPVARSRAAPLLADESPLVRLAAVRAYAALAESNGAARLRDRYAAEKDSTVRAAVVEAFGEHRRLRGALAWEVERLALASGSAPEILAALRNLAVNRDHDAQEGLAAALGAPEREVRAEALRTIAVLRDRRLRPAVEKLLAGEEDEGLHALAAQTLLALR